MREMVSSASWLGQWMLTEEVTSTQQLARALGDPDVRRRLWETVARVPYTTDPLPPLSGPSLLAGKTIDLSGELDCCLAWECRQRDIEKLFSKVWHYFDHIVIVGPSAAIVRNALERNDEEWALAKINADAQLLLYLHGIGADDLVLFREKPPACVAHVLDHARSVGIDGIDDLIEDEARRLMPHARIDVGFDNECMHYTFNHELLAHTRWGHIPAVEADDKIRIAVCRDVAATFAAHLISDLTSAQYLQLPLGAALKLHGQMLAHIEGRRESTSDVAFHLDLPFLDGVSLKDLLALRRKEYESFEAFRISLTRAVIERTKSGADTPAVVAEIQQDLIYPALNEIALRLRRVESSLTKKHAINVALTAVSVACGLLKAPDLALTFIGSTTLAAAAAQSSAIDQRTEIALSDMYFLWKAAGLKRETDSRQQF